MKKNTLTLGIYAAMLLSSTLAIAEDEFPAADFQPKVIFQNSTVSESSQSANTPVSSETSATDSNYPAADYQPKVLYQNESASTTSSAAPSAINEQPKTQSTTTVDAEHPAADFQPKVLFSDTEHKTTPAKNVGASAATVSSKTTASAIAAEDDEEEASDYSLFGIGLLALVAIGLTRCKSICKLRAATSDTNPPSTHAKNNGKTGVANYLDTHNKSTLSGVAKYLANKSEAKPTGVENYLRKRG